jgi:hypothetical protein
VCWFSFCYLAFFFGLEFPGQVEVPLTKVPPQYPLGAAGAGHFGACSLFFDGLTLENLLMNGTVISRQ